MLDTAEEKTDKMKVISEEILPKVQKWNIKKQKEWVVKRHGRWNGDPICLKGISEAPKENGKEAKIWRDNGLDFSGIDLKIYGSAYIKDSKTAMRPK